MAFHYTPDMLCFLTKNKTMNRKDLTIVFNKKFNTQKSIEQIRSLCKRMGLKTGRTGRFNAGHKPANKGAKGLTKANSGSFKKGHPPHNYKPIGSQRISKSDGCIQIKTAEPNVWRYKQRVLWEQCYGQIPPAHVIRFIDGNQQNCVIENLECVSKRENAVLNRTGYTQVPIECKPAFKSIVKIKIKLGDINRNE